ncbi:MAG: hypothetical protein ACLPYB_03995 [Desulfobaccales bacterium]
MSAEPKIKRMRSPNFPAVTLEKSLQQAQALLDKYSRNQIAWQVGRKTLGFTDRGSGGKQAIASLGYYGLIKVEGSGEGKKIAISDLAFKILADKREVSPEREMAIYEAALNPPIYQKIIEHYPNGLPANDALEWELVSTYKFNTESVRDFINAFRETLAFAKVYESGIIGDKYTPPEAPIQELQGDKPMIQPEVARLRAPIPPAAPTARPISEGEFEISKFFLGKDISVRIVASAPITKFTQKTIDKLIRHLELDKEDLPEDDIEKPGDE